MNSDRSRLVGAAAVVAVAAFLPWVSVLGIQVSGTRGDGKITLVLALIGVAVAGALDAGAVWPRRSLIGLAVLVLLVALDHVGSFAAVGVYVTLLAGAAWVVFAWRAKPEEEEEG